MRPVVITSLALSVSGALPALAGDGIEVMTQNQYLGAEFASLAAQAPEDVNEALVAILQQIAATDFVARARRQAEEIAARRPDLVGLQETWALSCADAKLSDGQGCEDSSIAGAFGDYLQLTLDALGDLGADYEAVAIVKNLDLRSLTITPDSGPVSSPGGLPFSIDGAEALLIAEDRDVILARSDTVLDPVPVSFPGPICRMSQQGCNYQVVLPVAVDVPGGVLRVNFERGFVGVDATVEGKDYRFVNTHLEVREPQPGNAASRVFQAAQAAQLIAGLELTTPPELSLIIVGDMNSSPDDEPIPGPLPLPPPFDMGIVPPYMQFVDAGYTDIWTLRPGADRGFTCCQAIDLANRRSTLSERIDMIFSLEVPEKVKQARVVGDRISDKTPPPGPRLWPSDHGGVVAGLELGRPGDHRNLRAGATEF